MLKIFCDVCEKEVGETVDVTRVINDALAVDILPRHPDVSREAQVALTQQNHLCPECMDAVYNTLVKRLKS